MISFVDAKGFGALSTIWLRILKSVTRRTASELGFGTKKPRLHHFDGSLGGTLSMMSSASRFFTTFSASAL